MLGSASLQRASRHLNNTSKKAASMNSDEDLELLSALGETLDEKPKKKLGR